MRLFLKIWILTLLLMIWNHAGSQIINLEISGFRNHDGQVCVAIFTDNQAFRLEKPFWENCYSKKEWIRHHKMNFQIRLTPGIYGVTVLDDENMDGKMHFNFLGVPTEGFGFGNFESRGISRPHFDRFSFELKKGDELKVHVRMRYL